MSTTTEKPAQQDRFLADARELEKSRRADWTADLRKAGLARYAESGLPTTDDEEWKYTSLESLAQHPLKPARALQPDVVIEHDEKLFTYGLTKGPRVVFVNGLFSKKHSRIGTLPKGIWVGSLAEAIATKRELVEPVLGKVAKPGFTATAGLNLALFQDGVFIHAADGTVLEDPVHVVNLAHGEFASHPRHVVAAGKNAQLQVLESWSSPSCDRYFTNAVTEFLLAENARVTAMRIQAESGNAWHVASTQARLATGAYLHHSNSVTGAELFRHDLGALLDGERAEVQMFGLTVVSGHQHADSHTVIDHSKPHCPSREYYKAILNGRSRSVFNGKVFVRLDAQKTDAKQTNKNLLLSDDARVDTKPQLEIFADDVKCTHGATVGQLDDEMVFYCRSRGLQPEVARGILTYAFARDVIQYFGIPAVRDSIDNSLSQRLLDAGKNL